MTALRDEGKIGAIGLSSVTLDGLRRALPAGVVCVQNAYSLVSRDDEDMLRLCAAEGIAWVPFFPLGGAFPGLPKVTDEPAVLAAAESLGVTPARSASPGCCTTPRTCCSSPAPPTPASRGQHRGRDHPRRRDPRRAGRDPDTPVRRPAPLLTQRVAATRRQGGGAYPTPARRPAPGRRANRSGAGARTTGAWAPTRPEGAGPLPPPPDARPPGGPAPSREPGSPARGRQRDGRGRGRRGGVLDADVYLWRLFPAHPTSPGAGAKNIRSRAPPRRPRTRHPARTPGAPTSHPHPAPHPHPPHPSAITTADATPASWLSETCQRPHAQLGRARRDRAAHRAAAGGRCPRRTPRRPSSAGRPGAPSALASASLAANRAASEAMPRRSPLGSSSSPLERRAVRPCRGVRSSDAANRSISATSIPTPMITALTLVALTPPSPTSPGCAAGRPRCPGPWPARRRRPAAAPSRPAAAAASAWPGSRIRWSAYGTTASSPSSAITMVRAPRARISWMLETILSCRTRPPARRRHDHHDRQVLLDQRDRPVLQLARREALGVHVRQLLELQRALQRDRDSPRAGRGTARCSCRRASGPAPAPAPWSPGPARPAPEIVATAPGSTARISSPHLVPRTWPRYSATR